jgi:hypothetical protein
MQTRYALILAQCGKIGKIQEPSARRLWPTMNLPYEKLAKAIEYMQRLRSNLSRAKVTTQIGWIRPQFCMTISLKPAFECTISGILEVLDRAGKIGALGGILAKNGATLIGAIN